MAYCRVGEGWERRVRPARTLEELGLRHVSAVRLVLADGRPRAEALGLGSRLSHVVPITLKLAARLVEAGVPLVDRTPAPTAGAA